MTLKNLLLVFAICLLNGFLFESVRAAEIDANDLSKEADTHLGNDWKGILYVCNPFCEFISLREDKVWNPPLNRAKIDWNHSKGIAESDPLYPLLIVKEPVFPFVTGKVAKEQQDKKTDLVKPPKYAQFDFNWGIAISGGFIFSQSNWSGNTALQQDLSSQGIQYTPTALFQVMKGQPTHFFNIWTLHQFDLQAALSPNYKSKDDYLHIQNQEFSLAYQMWFPFPSFRIGPRLTYDMESWSVPTNSLQHFSFTRQSWLLGVTAIWNHWEVLFDTSLISQISEQQQFRQEPFTLNWYRLKLQKCSPDLTLFDVPYGICGGVSALLDQQKAAFADDLLIQGQSNLNRTDLGAYFLIRIGEDLYQ